jgi:hypothetical protein
VGAVLESLTAMKWKTLLWTIVASILIFFILVYLGMKFQWVRALQHTKTLENEKIILAIPEATNTVRPPLELLEEKERLERLKAEKLSIKSYPYSLVGEETRRVNFKGMSRKAVVKECRRISKKVGIPAGQFKQSVNECTVRNFQGRTTANMARSRNAQIALRRQCKQTFPTDQQALFSPEEMKLLIDECVADLHKKNK